MTGPSATVASITALPRTRKPTTINRVESPINRATTVLGAGSLSMQMSGRPPIMSRGDPH